MPPCKIDVKLNEGDEIKIGKLKLKVWHTPGHTPGQLSFKLGNLLFSGDNIYKDGCVGAIDAHHGSNLPNFIESLTRIRDDDAEFLLPSHGPVFRKDPKILQNAIDRLTKYQHMADFGTCAVSWPLQEQWERGHRSRARCRSSDPTSLMCGKADRGRPSPCHLSKKPPGVRRMFRRAFKFMLFASALGMGALIAAAVSARLSRGRAIPPPRNAPSGR